MAREEPSRAQWVPIALGVAALIAGVALGLRGSSCSDEPASGAGGSDAGGAAPIEMAPSAEPAPVDAPERYTPDLSGDEAGTVLVKGAEPANGLAVVGERLVWLATEGAALSAAPLAGGEARRLHATDDEEAFGGSFAASERRVCWVVAQLGSADAPILCLPADALDAKPERIAEAGSPDELALAGATLYWADRGALASWRPGQTEVAVVRSGDARIAALALDDATPLWLEIPYAAGARGRHRLMRRDERDEVIATLSEPRERRLLWAHDGKVGWAEGGEDGWELMLWDGDAPRALARAGEVTALVVDAATIWWAEAHTVDGGTVSLLRRMRAAAGARAERLGRVSGAVAALAVAKGVLYWSEDRGIVGLNPKP